MIEGESIHDIDDEILETHAYYCAKDGQLKVARLLRDDFIKLWRLHRFLYLLGVHKPLEKELFWTMLRNGSTPLNARRVRWNET